MEWNKGRREREGGKKKEVRWRGASENNCQCLRLYNVEWTE
jgi:hypothetical protein